MWSIFKPMWLPDSWKHISLRSQSSKDLKTLGHGVLRSFSRHWCGQHNWSDVSIHGYMIHVTAVFLSTEDFVELNSVGIIFACELTCLGTLWICVQTRKLVW